MLNTWKPRGSQDPHMWDVVVLALRHEEHREALVVQLMLMQEPPNTTERMSLRQRLLGKLQTIKLPGSYGLILTNPTNDKSPYNFTVRGMQLLFRDHLINKARDYHTEFNWDYAWFEDIGAPGVSGRNRAAGRSPTELGKAMRTNIRLIMPSLTDHTYREKGVTYGE